MDSIEQFIEREEARRERRNIRDRLAREFLREHPEIKVDPEGSIDCSEIPEGTSEAAIRTVARFYKRQAYVREVVNERSRN